MVVAIINDDAARKEIARPVLDVSSIGSRQRIRR